MFCYVLIVLIILAIIPTYKYYYNLKNEINFFYQDLGELKKDYIPYSKIQYLKNNYQNLYNITNNIPFLFQRFNEYYKNLETNINRLNKEYINKELVNQKDYFEGLFEYSIDINQREAIITNDDNNLIVAGAGSGKTTTIIGKIKYLIDKKNINPNEIIAISFTKATVENFKRKLNNDLVQCTTFHKLGLDIINQNTTKKDIAKDELLTDIIHKYLKEDIYESPEKIKCFINFCALYMHMPTDTSNKNLGEIYEIESGYDLETIKSKYTNYQTLKNNHNLNTLKNEKVKSYEELVIANYLFINGINYEYETSYKYDTSTSKYRQYHPDFYLVDYDIYLEHFGINEQGRAPQYSKIEEQKYLEGIKAKRIIHKKYKTTLIETYSYNFKNNTIFKRIDEELKKHNIEYKPLNYEELSKVILAYPNNELQAFYTLIKKFIKMYKGNNYSENKIDEFLLDAIRKHNTRNILLLTIIKDIYLTYQNRLKQLKQIDFDDMINLATKKVEDGGYTKKVSYIIIDEFQDISYSRYSLIKVIQEKNNAKVIAVGDDWQSIYRFSGCDLDLFVHFSKYFKHPKIVYINNTYRNSQDLINISSTFIMKNKLGQIPKQIYSNITLNKPIEFYYYKNNILEATKKAVESLQKNGCKKIAILGRNNSDLKNYINKTITDTEYNLQDVFNFSVIFTTVHKAKGLEYDGVIICNMNNFIAGFPNKMSDDPVLDYVTLSKEDYLYEEERRLFYVALTRTKSKCILLVPILTPSIFVNELYNIGKENINKVIIEDDERLHNPNCPLCQTGKLLVRINNQDNSSFVSCSNYPKCKFKYHSINIIKKPIKCPDCGAYLVKRVGMYGEFYGCINYPHCTRSANIDTTDK